MQNDLLKFSAAAAAAASLFCEDWKSKVVQNLAKWTSLTESLLLKTFLPAIWRVFQKTPIWKFARLVVDVTRALAWARARHSLQHFNSQSSTFKVNQPIRIARSNENNRIFTRAVVIQEHPMLFTTRAAPFIWEFLCFSDWLKSSLNDFHSRKCIGGLFLAREGAWRRRRSRALCTTYMSPRKVGPGIRLRGPPGLDWWDSSKTCQQCGIACLESTMTPLRLNSKNLFILIGKLRCSTSSSLWLEVHFAPFFHEKSQHQALSSLLESYQKLVILSFMTMLST